MYTIYKITNTVNGKFYIGFTTKNPPEKRFEDHKKAARNGSPYHLHRSMRKENPGAFTFFIKEQGEDNDYGLKVLEPKYIAELRPEYNMTAGGEGSCGWKPGRSPSPEHRANISAVLKVSCRAQEARAKVHKAQFGVPHPQSKVTCSKCNRTGGKNAMKRYHFENCPKSSNS